RKFEANHGDAETVALSPDGKVLASCGISTTPIRLRDSKTGQEVRRLLSERTARSLIFSPDGKVLVAGHDDVVVVWDVSSGKRIRDFPGSGVPISLSGDGKVLAAYGFRGHKNPRNRILLWDLATGKLLGESGTKKATYIIALSFSFDS